MAHIERIPGVVFTDPTIPKLTRDKMINAGTKFLYDTKSSYCFPRQANPISGDSLLNLVDNAPSATIIGNDMTFVGGGIYLPGTGGNSKIDLGSTYGVAATNKFRVGIWLKMQTGYNASDFYNPIFSRGGSTGVNGTQYYIDNGANGRRLRGSIASAAAAAATADIGGDISLDTPHLLELAWEDGTLKVFLNGVLKNTFPLSAPLANLTANTFIGGGNWRGTVYRFFLEDLTVSGKTAAAQTLAEYNAYVGRFS